MHLNHGLHLGYCTNIHRGETWAETFDSLQQNTLAIRARVSPDKPYGIGLRLSDLASRELSDPAVLRAFRRWLDQRQCYVFTINGFPYGRFHGAGVKEHVYQPDWTTPERLQYTNRLFDLLAQLLPPGVEGSVSTLPGSFKGHVTRPEQFAAIRDNLFACIEHGVRVCDAANRSMQLGLEPEPLCLIENSRETVELFDKLCAEHSNDERILRFLGVTYDTCHLAIEFEKPLEAVTRFRERGIRLSKIHLSSALSLKPTPEALEALGAFAEGAYLHQVIIRGEDGQLTRWKDLPEALAGARATPPSDQSEWRVHYHIPLHHEPGGWFGNTTDHLLGVLDLLAADPALCRNLEMETYTWEVLPAALKNRSVVDQLASEYQWCLGQLGRRGLVDSGV